MQDVLVCEVLDSDPRKQYWQEHCADFTVYSGIIKELEGLFRGKSGSGSDICG